LINKPDVTKEELAAAYLTVFYDCNLTQSGLSTIIKLSNITSGIKLPTNFDGLLNLLTKKKLIDYEKRYFCGRCLILLTDLQHRSQRACSACKTRLLTGIKNNNKIV
jgi:DNA-directed RNA polymerase subunit RPC12/RpoP